MGVYNFIDKVRLPAIIEVQVASASPRKGQNLRKAVKVNL